MQATRRSSSDNDSDSDVADRDVAFLARPQQAGAVTSVEASEQPNRSVLASRESVATGKGVTVAVRVRPLHPQLERHQHSVIACGHGSEGVDASSATTGTLNSPSSTARNESDQEHPQPYVEVARFSGKNAAGAGSTSATAAAARKAGSDGQRAIIPSTQNQRFFFDVVLDEDETQHSAYDTLVAHKLATALDRGESLTVMAYGQTASGKTFTMIGDDPEGGGVVHSPRHKRPATATASAAAKADECEYDDDEELDPDTLTSTNGAERISNDAERAASAEGSLFTTNSGILLRVLYDVFEYQRHMQLADPTRCVAVVVSVVELYNNKIRDLIADHSVAIRRKSAVSVLLGGEIVTHEAGDSLIVQGNTHALVESFESAQRWVAAAARNRVVAATKMNMASSRGHALYFIDVFQLRKRGGTSSLLNDTNASRTIPDLDGLIRLRTSVLTYSGRAASRVTGTSAAGLMAPVVPAMLAPTGNRSIEQRVGQKAGGVEMQSAATGHSSRSKTPTLGRAPSPSRGALASANANSSADGQRPRRSSLGSGYAGRPSTDLSGRELPSSNVSGSTTTASAHGEYVMEALTRISIIDLAGSERLKRVSVNDEVIVAETKFVNQSLSALGNVINALSNSDATHIPFRSNKLTRLLRPSFIASKVVFIATISPAEINAAESVCTLRFASFLKNTKEAVVTCTRSALATTLLINDVTNGERTQEEMTTDVRLAYLHRQPLFFPDVREDDEKDDLRGIARRSNPNDLLARVSARKFAVDETIRAYEKIHGDGWRRDASAADEVLAAVSTTTQVYTAGAMQKYLKQLQLSLSAWRVLQKKGLSELGVSLSRIMAAGDAPEPSAPGLPSISLSDVIVDLPSLKRYMAGCKDRYMNTTLYKSPVMIKRWMALKQTIEKIYTTSQRILIEEEAAARLELTTEEVDCWGSMTVQEGKEHAMALVLRGKRRHGELKQARAQLRQKEAELIELTEPISEEALRNESVKDSIVEKMRSLVHKLQTRSELLVQNANTLKTMQYFLDREEEEMEMKEEAKLREEMALTSRRRGSLGGLASSRSSMSKLPRQPPSARFSQRTSLHQSSEKESLPSKKPRVTRSAVIHNPLFVHFEMLPTALPTREARVRTADDVGTSTSRRSSTEETSNSSQSPQSWQEPSARCNGARKSPGKGDWLSWEVPGASTEKTRNSIHTDLSARAQPQMGSSRNNGAKSSTVPGVIVVEYPKILERDLTLMISPMSASHSLRSDSPLETQRGVYEEGSEFTGGNGGAGESQKFFLEERSAGELSERQGNALSRQSEALLPHLNNENFSIFQVAAEDDVVNGIDPPQQSNLTPPATSCRTSPSCKTASNSHSALELLIQRRSPSAAALNLSPAPEMGMGVGGMLRVCGRNADVMFLMESCSASCSAPWKRRRSSRLGVGIILEPFSMERHLSLLTQIAVIIRRFQRTRSLLSTPAVPTKTAVPVLSPAQTPGKTDISAADHSPRKQALLKRRQVATKRASVGSEAPGNVGTPQRGSGHRESHVEVPNERERYVSDARSLWRMLSEILDSSVVDLTTLDDLMGSILMSTAGEDVTLRQELLRRGWFSPVQVTDELLQLLTQDAELRKAYLDGTAAVGGTPISTPLTTDSINSPLNCALPGPPNPGAMIAMELIRSIQLLSLFTKCVAELRKRTTGRLKSIQSGMDGADDLLTFGSVCGKSFLVDLTQPTPSSPGATNDSFLGQDLQQTDSDVRAIRSSQSLTNQDGLLVLRGVNPTSQEDWVDERLDAILDDRRDAHRRSVQSSSIASSMGDLLDNGSNPSMTPLSNGWGPHSPNAIAGSLAEISSGVVLLDADQLAQTGSATTLDQNLGCGDRSNGYTSPSTKKNVAGSTNESVAPPSSSLNVQPNTLFPTLTANGGGGGARPIIRRGSNSAAPSTSPTYRSIGGGGDNDSSIRADVLAETISCSTLEKQEIPKWRTHLKKTVLAYLARSAMRRSSIDAAAGLLSPKPVVPNVVTALEDTPAELAEDDRDVSLWAFMCRLAAVN